MEQSYNATPGSSFGGMNPGGPPPKNWLVESILVTIFCCLPFGIVGIINAAAVNTKWSQGDYEGARIASIGAGKWTKIGFFVGIGINVLLAVLWVLGVGAAIMQGRTGNY
jgi:hypothetical protein